MKIFSTADEVIKAIENCEDKKEANLAMKALVKLAVHDKSIDKDDFPQDTLAGQVLMSTMMLAVRNF